MSTSTLSPNPQAVAAPEVSVGNHQLYSFGSIRVLVIDDDRPIGDLIRTALEPNGFDIDVVMDPTELPQRLSETEYHLILMDYVLPGVESSTVLDWIQQHQSDASLVVMTAYPSMDSAVTALRARAYDYVQKPFSLQHLQDVVTRCLESRGLLRLSEEALRETLGKAIRERHKAAGLTLAQMAERTGVSLGYLSQIELGKNSASIEMLYRISLGLGTRLNELFQSLELML